MRLFVNPGQPTDSMLVVGRQSVVVWPGCCIPVMLWQQRERVRAGLNACMSLSWAGTSAGTTAVVPGLVNDRERLILVTRQPWHGVQGCCLPKTEGVGHMS